MFKFLLYLFLFYILFRFIFGTLLKGVFKAKVININHNHYHQNEKPEGKIVIDPKTVKNPKPDDKNLGEYVEYEEVK